MDVTSILFPAVAIGGLGVLFGAGLGFAAKKFAVEVDERVEQIKENLPGANCGGCGFAGCEAFAKAVVEGASKPNGCSVCNAEQIQAIATIMGTTAEIGEKKRAIVACQGTRERAKEKNEYYGIIDCRDATLLPGGGSKSCRYGCLGLGTCEKVCVFGAISIEDGVAVVDESKCTACGTCAATCPKQIISVVPASLAYHVSCKSLDKGKDAKANCSVACIGCGICARNCPEKVITLENNVATIDQEKCTHCGVCEQKCPTKAIAQILHA